MDEPELGQDPILQKKLTDIRPAPENDQLYRPVDQSDPEIRALAESIRQRGVREPLVVTLDGWLLSGHRRHVAAQLAGLVSVPCRVEPIRRSDDPDEFLVLLREYNRQREKTLAEKLREEVVTADPEEAYRQLTEYRRNAAHVDVDGFEIDGEKRRAAISKAKAPFLEAVLRVLAARRDFWPLSDRAIHYALLNDPPLIHASKPDSTYQNTPACYKSLVDLLTRARLERQVPWNAIADSTRPVTTWNVFDDPRQFIRQQIDRFLKGYYRNLMQSQPNHVEIVGEKATIDPILGQVAADYTIPLTTGRGFCSLPPRYQMAQRFKRSGKEKLILLLVSDFDPDGEEIAHSFARSMRDDFDIREILPIKVALTAEQVVEYRLPPQMSAKASSVNYAKFVKRHGDDVFEVEALAPETLQQILRDAIDRAIAIDAFNAEVSAEKTDAAFLDGVRETVHNALAAMKWDEEGLEL